jgi:hypothetical protein
MAARLAATVEGQEWIVHSEAPVIQRPQTAECLVSLPASSPRLRHATAGARGARSRVAGMAARLATVEGQEQIVRSQALVIQGPQPAARPAAQAMSVKSRSASWQFRSGPELLASVQSTVWAPIHSPLSAAMGSMVQPASADSMPTVSMLFRPEPVEARRADLMTTSRVEFASRSPIPWRHRR